MILVLSLRPSESVLVRFPEASALATRHLVMDGKRYEQDSWAVRLGSS